MGRIIKVITVVLVDETKNPEWFERCRRYDVQTLEGLQKNGQWAGTLASSIMGECHVVGVQHAEP